MGFLYSDGWNSDLFSLGDGTVPKYSGDGIRDLSIAPIVETENYYYLIRSTSLQSEDHISLISVNKKTLEIIAKNRIGERMDRLLTISGDNLVFWSAGILGGFSIRRKKITPDMKTTEEWFEIEKPEIPGVDLGRMIIDCIRVKQNGDLIVESKIEIDDNSFPSKYMRFEVRAKAEFGTPTLVAKENTFENGDGIRLVRSKLRAIGECEIFCRRADGKTIVSGEFGSNILTGRYRVDASTQLINLPRSNHHEAVRGKMGILLGDLNGKKNLLLTCGHDRRQRFIDVGEMEPNTICAVDSQDNFYLVINRDGRRRLTKCSDSGKKLWEMTVTDDENKTMIGYEYQYVADFRFSENQSKILFIGTKNSYAFGSNNLYCLDASTGEVLWTYNAKIGTNGGALSAQLPLARLYIPILMMDYYNADTKKYEPRILAHRGTWEAGVDLLPMEIIHLSTGNFKTCDRIPAHAKYLAR